MTKEEQIRALREATTKIAGRTKIEWPPLSSTAKASIDKEVVPNPVPTRSISRTSPTNKTMPAPSEGRAKFDRVKYQREYMRRYRAKLLDNQSKPE